MHCDPIVPPLRRVESREERVKKWGSGRKRYTVIVVEKGGEERGAIERITEGIGVDGVRARGEERHTSHMMKGSRPSDRDSG